MAYYRSREGGHSPGANPNIEDNMSNKIIEIRKYAKSGRIFANDSEIFAAPERPAGFCGEWVTPYDLRDKDAEICSAILATVLDGQDRNLDYTDAAAEAKREAECDDMDRHQARMARVMATQG